MIIRNISKGMGQAVAERTILRKNDLGEYETWKDVSSRVALGNSLLCLTTEESKEEFKTLQRLFSKGIMLSSGRHLQHGDASQPTRNLEIFTNCSTAPASFLLFYNTLNGSGVGRSYDDDIMLVNWDYAPNIRCVLDESHPDFDYSAHESVRDAKHKYGNNKDVLWFKVPDSREGWAQAVELWENAAFEKIHKDKILVLDFSPIRRKGSPIGGMQNRPCSGPVPLMNAFNKANSIRNSGLQPWMQAMYIDHYLAECVLVGGARRSARIGTKHWKDSSIFDFINLKRPIEFIGKTQEEIRELRSKNSFTSFLWSSNNSVLVDEEFWNYLEIGRHSYAIDTTKTDMKLVEHALKVFDAICFASYCDGTGEPGIINAHLLVQNDKDWNDLSRGDYVGSQKYTVNEDTQIYLAKIGRKAKKKKYHMIVNPCAEIVLSLAGGYCVIGDVCPYFGDSFDEIEESCRAMVRFLMRTNLLDSVYKKEVLRTQRIGVSLTGVHEFAWKFFRYNFEDLVDEKKSQDFWNVLGRFSRACFDEAQKYAKVLNINVPHTVTTIKPSGTISKIFGLTEGWHLPSMGYYLRWVQFRHDDLLVQEYKNRGYPVRELTTYKGTVIIGFPTEPLICSLGLNKLITAGDATMEQQYTWVKLGEKYWLRGCDENGQYPEVNYSNNISYTLKYKPTITTLAEFKNKVEQNQKVIKCCSVMPQENLTSYEYQPEEPVSYEQYMEIKSKIKEDIKEDISREHIDCSSGGCPIDFKDTK